MKIRITELVNPCISRTRGKEAALKLLKKMNGEQVFIDTTKTDILSFSFLDEIIFWLASSRNMGKIVFNIDSPITEDKLSRIAAIRGVDIHYRTAMKSEVKLLSPKASPSADARFVSEKASLKL